MSDARPPDTLMGGRLLLRQLANGHRAGTDAMVLAAAAPKTSGLIVDAGAGTGAAGLVLVMRCPQARLTLLEIDPGLASLGADNLSLNGFGERGRSVCVDLLHPKARRAADVEDGQADVVLTNPPYLQAHRARVSPTATRALAHAEAVDSGGLDAWMRAVTALLKPGGTLVMIHRADRLADCLETMAGRVGGIAILPVAPRGDADAIRVVLTGTKGSKAPLRLRAPLVLHEADGGFTPEAAALHMGEALPNSSHQ